MDRQDLHDLAVDEPIDLHAEGNTHDRLILPDDLCHFFLFTEIDQVDLRWRNIDFLIEHRGERGRHGAHHLVHGLTDSAHRDLADVRVWIRAVAAHHEVGDDGGVMRLDSQHIIAIDARRIADLDNEVRQRIMLLDDAHRRHSDRRRRDVDLMSQKNRQRRRGTSHRDIADFSERVLLCIRQNTCELR